MAFPFSFKYLRSFDKELSAEEKANVIKCINDFLQKKSGVNVETIYDSIEYKETFWLVGSSFLKSAERGVFKIVDEDGRSKITYEIFMHRLFIIAAIMGAGFWAVSQSFWGLVMCILWLGGANCLLTIVHHGTTLNATKAACDKLISIEKDQTP